MNPLDKYFKDQLGNAQKQSPHHLWDAIEKQLEEPASARRIGWLGWSSAGLLGIALLLGGTYLWQNSSSTDTVLPTVDGIEANDGARTTPQMFDENVPILDAKNAEPSTNQGHQSIAQASSDGVEVKASYDNFLESITDTSKASYSQVNQIASNQNNQNLRIEKEGYDVAFESKQNRTSNTEKSAGVIGSVGDIAVSTSASTAEEKQKTIATNTKAKNNASTLSTAIVQNVDNGSRQEGFEALGGQQSGLSNNQGEIKQGIPHNSKEIAWTIEVSENVTVNTVPSKLMKSQETYRAREIERSVLPIMNIVQMGLEGSAIDRLNTIQADLAPVAYTQCPTFSNNDRTGLYFDALVSHDLPMSRLSTSNSSLQGEVDMRAMSEAMQYSNAFGGRLSLTLPNGLTFRTGLQYTLMRQQVTFVDEGTNEQTIDNQYTFFDIPFLVGKEFGQNGSRWYFAANGGILLNVLQSQEGSVRTTGMQLLGFDNLTPDGKSGYEDSAGLAGYASFAIYYRWLQSADLFIEPNVRYGLGSLTKEAYGIDHNFTTVGVATGLRYRF